MILAIIYSNRDGRLQVGDEVLMINGVRTDGLTSEQASDILQKGACVLQLVITRIVSLHLSVL